jgi:hypothetical protein
MAIMKKKKRTKSKWAAAPLTTAAKRAAAAAAAARLKADGRRPPRDNRDDVHAAFYLKLVSATAALGQSRRQATRSRLGQLLRKIWLSVFD